MLKGSMLHKRQASYSASPAHHPESSKLAHRNSQHQRDEDASSNLRLDVPSHYSQAKAQFPLSKLGDSRRNGGASSAAIVPAQPSLTPSKVQHALRRCHSASAVRKRLQNAVEHSQFGSKFEQSEALRTFGRKNSASVVSTNNAERHQLNVQQNEPQRLRRNSMEKPTGGGSTNLQAKSAGLVRSFSGILTQTHQRGFHNPGTDYASVSTGSSSILWCRSSSATPTAGDGSVSVVGGYKSSSVQMEVELAERLNEIDRSKVHGRSLLRVRACQNIFDTIVKQDELYGRLLSRIRDEYNAFVESSATLEALNDINGHECCRACGRPERMDVESNNNSNLTFEYALLRQENAVIKRSCTAMQAEITRLQTELRLAHSRSDGNNDTGEYSLDEDPQDLSDVQLFFSSSPLRRISRPTGIPKLDFGALSPYNEDEDNEEEEEEEVEEPYPVGSYQ